MSSLQYLCRLVLVCLALQLGACSIYSVPGSEPVPIEKKPDYTEVPPTPATPAVPSRPSDPNATAAYQPLLARADEAVARGDYEEALALLERAQRIDPDSAEVYLSMARAHSARGDAAQASATANRGLLYCTSSTECNALRAYIR